MQDIGEHVPSKRCATGGTQNPTARALQISSAGNKINISKSAVLTVTFLQAFVEFFCASAACQAASLWSAFRTSDAKLAGPDSKRAWNGFADSSLRLKVRSSE